MGLLEKIRRFRRNYKGWIEYDYMRALGLARHTAIEEQVKEDIARFEQNKPCVRTHAKQDGTNKSKRRN